LQEARIKHARVWCQNSIAVKSAKIQALATPQRKAFLSSAPSLAAGLNLTMSSLPLRFLLLTVAGWMTRDQQKVIEYPV